MGEVALCSPAFKYFTSPCSAAQSETIGYEMMWAHIGHLQTGVACREWADFAYQTRKSWSRERRVESRRRWSNLEPFSNSMRA